jgi:hypothetical protein
MEKVLLALHGEGIHSSLSALFGSTAAARFAGIQDDTVAMARKSSTIDTNVSGSVGFTPTSIVVINRVSMSAATMPMITPIALKPRP